MPAPLHPRTAPLRWLVLLSALAGIAAPTPAQQPLGDEFLVNTVTTNGQRASAAAALAGGGFVVVWATESDGDQHGVAGRFVEPGGAMPDPEFLVNTYTTGDQYRPAVAALEDGGFVVVWESVGSPGSDGDEKAVLARVYDAEGAPVAGEFQVNTYTTAYQYAPAVAALDGGGFVVAWWSYGFEGSSGYGSILSRRYDASGAELGDEVPVTDFDDTGQPAVAGLPGGGFVVVWTSEEFAGVDTSGQGVRGARYDAAGVPDGSSFQVNTDTTGDQNEPSVSSDAEGNLFVAWTSGAALGGDMPEVRGRRYEPEGTALGSDFRINSYSTGAQETPSVAADPSGAFTVSWESSGSTGSDGSGPSVQARVYLPSGQPLDDEVQVNALTTGFQGQPAVAADSTGELLVTWTHGGIGQVGDGDVAVEGRRFAQPHVFSDGFERNGSCRWSLTEGTGVPCF